MVEPVSIACRFDTVEVDDGTSLREVHLAVPSGPAPPDGWPVVWMFQGSFVSSESFFEGSVEAGLDQARVVAELIDGGFAVLAPEAQGDGSRFWDTNIAPWSTAWEDSRDHRLMTQLLADLDGGDLGHLDPERMLATGISSGGYMSSRVGIAYPGRFRALVIHSASYATCSGRRCAIPDPLPAGHPPTAFLHGASDRVVPIQTSRDYYDALVEIGTPSRIEVIEGGHSWFPSSGSEIRMWFETYGG